MATSTKPRTATIETLLGGADLVYRRKAGAGKLDTAVREGLPFRSFQTVAEALKLRTDELAELIGAAPRTIARRKRLKTLTTVESDRLVGIAHIAALALDVLGSKERVRDWLRDANPALGGITPLAGLDTEPGRRKVEDVLYQIRYGMIS